MCTYEIRLIGKSSVSAESMGSSCCAKDFYSLDTSNSLLWTLTHSLLLAFDLD